MGDLLSYCSLDETTKIDYSVKNPLNREPAVKELISSFLTPAPLAYNRNHCPIPHITCSKHFIRVNGQVPNPYNITVHQLATEFPQHEVTCALTCAGNRRHTMRTLLKEVDGIDWDDAAVMNCKWKGPRLRDVLIRAGVSDEGEREQEARGRKMHVWFSSYQVRCQEDEWFGGSVELGRCMDVSGEVILGLEMNNSPLPSNHGHPVRVIIPGISGSKWVKWLDRITVQDRESPNHYQRRDYRVLPPEATDKNSAEQFWDVSPPLYDVPINSAIAIPGSGDVIPCSPSGSNSDSESSSDSVSISSSNSTSNSDPGYRKIQVKGYAIPHGTSGPVIRVQVSADGGKNWVDATLEEPGRSMKWTWVLWRATISLPKGEGREIVSRAIDKGDNMQKEHSEWNLRGVGYNGYGRVSGLRVL